MNSEKHPSYQLLILLMVTRRTEPAQSRILDRPASSPVSTPRPPGYMPRRAFLNPLRLFGTRVKINYCLAFLSHFVTAALGLRLSCSPSHCILETTPDTVEKSWTLPGHAATESGGHVSECFGIGEVGGY
jgi:hypothetical protein